MATAADTQKGTIEHELSTCMTQPTCMASLQLGGVYIREGKAWAYFSPISLWFRFFFFFFDTSCCCGYMQETLDLVVRDIKIAAIKDLGFDTLSDPPAIVTICHIVGANA